MLSSRLRVWQRTVIAAMGLAVIGMGVSALRHNDLFYENSRGGLVVAPMAIVFGVTPIIASVWRVPVLETRR